MNKKLPGEWRGISLCNITKKLKKLEYEVYSKCMKPSLELINLEGKRLSKIPGKLGLSLFLETKSNQARLAKPDMVIVKNNHVQYIIKIEESKTPASISGIITSTRKAIICDINSSKVINGPFPVKNAILYILLKDNLSINTKTVINNTKSNKGNLSDIKLLIYDDFVNYINDYIK